MSSANNPAKNSEHKQPLTIGIDARLSGKKHAGIGRYIENLLIELPAAAAKNSTRKINWVYFFYDREQAAPVQQVLTDFSNITFVYCPIRHYSFAEQVKWPRILKKHKLELLHIPHFNIPLLYSGKIVITIHDLLWHQQIGPEATTLPGWKYYFKYLAYRLVAKQAVNRAAKIFVPTLTVKQTLLSYYPQLADKTIAAKEGISSNFKLAFDQSKEGLSSSLNQYDPNQLIYVGSLYPHKNIKAVLECLKQDPELKLVIVCARNVFMRRVQQKVKQLSIEQQVEFTGFLKDDLLIKKIQESLVLVQPSKSEGFGLTGIEAMACGTPVIASDIPVFKEIYQQAPVYFNPDSVAELLEAIQQMQDQEFRQKSIQQGFKVVSAYSWQNMAGKIYQNYQQLLNI